MCKLLATFCDHKEFFTRQNWYHGPNFRAKCGTIQGGIISPNLFKVMVDNVVWTRLEMIVKNQAVEKKGLCINVSTFLGLVYANDGMIGTQDSYWLQNAFNVLIGHFRWYRLVTNVARLQTMMCQPGTLRLGML